MLDRRLSISSRTGYEEQSLAGRVHEALAILAAMLTVAATITIALVIARLF